MPGAIGRRPIDVSHIPPALKISVEKYPGVSRNNTNDATGLRRGDTNLRVRRKEISLRVRVLENLKSGSEGVSGGTEVWPAPQGCPRLSWSLGALGPHA